MRGNGEPEEEPARSQEEPGGARRNQEELRGATGEEPWGARVYIWEPWVEEPGGATGEPGGAKIGTTTQKQKNVVVKISHPLLGERHACVRQARRSREEP